MLRFMTWYSEAQVIEIRAIGLQPLAQWLRFRIRFRRSLRFRISRSLMMPLTSGHNVKLGSNGILSLRRKRRAVADPSRKDPQRQPFNPGFALRCHTSECYMADGPGEKAEDVGLFERGAIRAADSPVAPTWSPLQNPYLDQILLVWAKIGEMHRCIHFLYESASSQQSVPWGLDP